MANARTEGWAKWIRTANDEAAVLEGCRFVPHHGYKVLWFAATFLKHTKGEWAGQPILFSEWQRDDMIMPLYSWVRPDGRRRFNTMQAWIAKKNGKSTIAAVLAAVHLLLEDEGGAEVYAAATSKKQATIVFGETARMIENNPMLRRMVKIYRGTKTIVRDAASWFTALPCDEAGTEGWNSSFVIVDELHAFGSKAFGVFEALRNSGAARRNPLTAVISHAGRSVTTPAYAEYTYAKKVQTGEIIDTSVLPIIYETDPDDDPGEPATWAKANPSLGLTLRVEEMQRVWTRCKGTAELRLGFEQRRLNRWVNAVMSWLDVYQWLKIKGSIPGPTTERMVWVIGLDLSSSNDLTAMALIGRNFDTDQYYLKTHFWIPGHEIEKKEARDQVSYQALASEGHCTICPRRVIDYTMVEKKVAETATLYKAEIAYDPWHATHLMQRLIREHNLRCYQIEQNINALTTPSKEFERRILASTITQCGNPIMTDHISKATIYTNVSGNIRPVKGGPRRTVSKIDGVIAGITGLARAMVIQDGALYASGGVMAL